MQHGLTLQHIMFALNQLPATSKAQVITSSIAFKEHALSVVRSLKVSYNLDTDVPRVLQVAFGSDLVPKELNFLIASKHVDSDLESDEDEDLGIAPTAWNLCITQGTATFSPAKKSRDLRAATRITTAEMAQAALYMLVAIITAYHGDEFSAVANEAVLFAPQLMARTKKDFGAMKRFLREFWITYKTTLAEAAAHAVLESPTFKFGSTLPSAVRRHLRVLPKDFAKTGITDAISKARKSQQRKATARTEQTAALLHAEQLRLADTIASKISLEAKRAPAPAPAPSPYGAGAGSGKSGRASTKADKKGGQATTGPNQPSKWHAQCPSHLARHEAGGTRKSAGPS